MSAATRPKKLDPGTECRQWVQEAKSGNLPKLLLLAGPARGEEEAWFSTEILQAVRTWARQQEGFDFMDLDAGESSFDPGHIDGFLQSNSLFATGGRGLVLGRAGKVLGKNNSLLESIAGAVASTEGPDWMVIHVDGTAGAKVATALNKKAGKHCTLVRFRRLYGDPPPWKPHDLDASEAAGFVRAEAKLLGIQLKRGASGALVQIAGARPAALRQSLEHFDLLNETEVTEERVREVVAHSAEGSAFEFADHLLAGDGAQAFRLLSKLRGRGLKTWDGKRIAPKDAFSMLVSVLAGERRKTAAVQSALFAGSSFAEACKQSGVAAGGPPAKRMERRLERCSEQSLESALKAILEAEVGVKTGARPDSIHALEELAMKCHRSRR